MSKKLVIAIVIIILLVISWLVLRGNLQQRITGPGFSKTLGEQTPISTQAPPVVPKTFEFDASTDLKAELEKVNPQVLDSDFE